MNQFCRGTYFKIEGVRTYRCAYTGSIYEAPKDFAFCPECSRGIISEECGELKIRTLYEVNLPRFGWIKIVGEYRDVI